MKKKSLIIVIACLLVIAALGAFLLPNQKADKHEFVTVQNGKFMLNGKEFRFIGTNNYYMHYESNAMIDDVINNAKDMGIKVIRVWGFFNGNTSNNTAHNAYMQYEPGKFGVPEDKAGAKDCFERLDYTIAAAKKADIKVVLVLANNWDDFGGANTYVDWVGKQGHDLFFTDPQVKQLYKDYVKYLTSRKNTYTNVLYRDEPAIMTWELMNEPRCESDKTGETLVKWVEEMSAYVKSLAPNQLVAVGDEGFFNRPGAKGFYEEGEWAYTGFSGVDWERLVAVKDVDYGTYHLYPEGWGIPEVCIEQWGTQYITDHIEAAKRLNKPAVLEEYGVNSGGSQNRLATYDVWNKTVYELGGAGSMFWILTGINDKELKDNSGDGIYDDYDGYRIMNDKSPVSELLKKYAARFNGESVPSDEPRAYLTTPAKPQEAKGTYKVYVKVVPQAEKVKQVETFINGQSKGKMAYSKMFENYEYRWDTTQEQDGAEISVKGVVTFKSGKQIETEAVNVIPANVVKLVEFKRYEFTADTMGAVSEGAYQAELKAVKHTSLNGGMLQVDASLPGKFEWEELKVKFPSPNYPEIGQTGKLVFTVYFEKALADSGVMSTEGKSVVNHYIALEPGWVKKGLEENKTALEKLEVVKLDDGKEYYKQSLELEFFPNDSLNGFALCPVFSMVKYDGPVYLDDVILFTKE